MRQEICSITCDSCSEPAVEYDSNETCVSQLDGKTMPCKSCSMLGVVHCDYENGRGYAGFYKVTNISLVDFGTLVEGYEAGQKKIDELYDEVAELRKQIRELKGGK